METSRTVESALGKSELRYVPEETIPDTMAMFESEDGTTDKTRTIPSHWICDHTAPGATAAARHKAVTAQAALETAYVVTAQAIARELTRGLA